MTDGPPDASDSLARWVAERLEQLDPESATALAATLGALLASADDTADTFPRVALLPVGDIPVPSDSCCSASYTAGALAAIRELLAGYDDARRVAAETRRRAQGPLPLAAQVIDALARQGPQRRADLARALDAAPTTIGRTLQRLVAGGLVQTLASLTDEHDVKVRRYSLTSAGTATVR